jgi:hypothetical protein
MVSYRLPHHTLQSARMRVCCRSTHLLSYRQRRDIGRAPRESHLTRVRSTTLHVGASTRQPPFARPLNPLPPYLPSSPRTRPQLRRYPATWEAMCRAHREGHLDAVPDTAQLNRYPANGGIPFHIGELTETETLRNLCKRSRAPCPSRCHLPPLYNRLERHGLQHMHVQLQLCVCYGAGTGHSRRGAGAVERLA